MIVTIRKEAILILEEFINFSDNLPKNIDNVILKIEHKLLEFEGILNTSEKIPNSKIQELSYILTFFILPWKGLKDKIRDSKLTPFIFINIDNENYYNHIHIDHNINYDNVKKIRSCDLFEEYEEILRKVDLKLCYGIKNNIIEPLLKIRNLIEESHHDLSLLNQYFENFENNIKDTSLSYDTSYIEIFIER